MGVRLYSDNPSVQQSRLRLRLGNCRVSLAEEVRQKLASVCSSTVCSSGVCLCSLSSGSAPGVWSMALVLLRPLEYNMDVPTLF